MKRFSILIYGIVNYLLGVASLTYLIAFLFNLHVPKTIDSGTSGDQLLAAVIDLGLIVLFGLQHSVMARPRFKTWLARFFPAAAERSTYMLATAVVVFTICFLWQPLPYVIWRADDFLLGSILLAIGLAGWVLVLASTFMIDHFDLFGLRQIWLNFLRREYRQTQFKTGGLYRHIRHPIMTGVFIGVWFTPLMSVGHLLFALGMSIYIVIGVYHEEKSLVENFDIKYRQYMDITGRYFPKLKTRSNSRRQA